MQPAAFLLVYAVRVAQPPAPALIKMPRGKSVRSILSQARNVFTLPPPVSQTPLSGAAEATKGSESLQAKVVE